MMNICLFDILQIKFPLRNMVTSFNRFEQEEPTKNKKRSKSEVFPSCYSFLSISQISNTLKMFFTIYMHCCFIHLEVSAHKFCFEDFKLFNYHLQIGSYFGEHTTNVVCGLRPDFYQVLT